MSPDGPVLLDVSLDLYVSLSEDRKGAHLSRNVEAADVISSIPEESWSLEALADTVHSQLLKLHTYSTSAKVVLSTRYWASVRVGDISSTEPLGVSVTVSGSRDRKRFTTSVTVKGMTVCPSAEETIRSILGYSGLSPSHNQRALLRGSITVDRLTVMRVEEVARCLWASFSSPVISKLKRDQEASLILSAYENPKFAEDVVRDAVMSLACHFRSVLTPSSQVKAEIVSLESIHPHNLYAMAKGVLSELPLSMCHDVC